MQVDTHKVTAVNLLCCIIQTGHQHQTLGLDADGMSILFSGVQF